MIINAQEIVLRCSECDAPVTNEEGQLVRQCDHHKAPVKADISAVVYGMATMGQPAAPEH
jgi:hypothetical protein